AAYRPLSSTALFLGLKSSTFVLHDSHAELTDVIEQLTFAVFMHKSLLAKIVPVLTGLACATAAHAQFVAFNDHDAGPGTAPNTTTYTADPASGISTGSLKNISTGASLPITLTVTAAGNVTFEGTQGNPAP